MGRSAGPFKGVCTQMWQKAVALVSVLTSCSKRRGCQWWCLRPRCCPFVLHFGSVALSWGVPQVQKREMQSAFAMFASFLSPTNALLWGQQVRDVIVGKTKRKYGQEHLLMPTRYSTLLFTALPFWPSPTSLPSFTLGFVHRSSLSPPSSCFGSADVSAQVLPDGQFQIQKVTRVFSGKWLNFATARLPNEAGELSCQWLRKNTSKHMVRVCSLNWIKWRPMGNHQGG